jgi:hypothetical protein
MEIINDGSDDLCQMAMLSCCWPPGSQTYENPTED